MDFKTLFLISSFFNIIMVSICYALWDSRNFWRNKWEKELDSHEKD